MEAEAAAAEAAEEAKKRAVREDMARERAEIIARLPPEPTGPDQSGNWSHDQARLPTPFSTTREGRDS